MRVFTVDLKNSAIHKSKYIHCTYLPARNIEFEVRLRNSSAADTFFQKAGNFLKLNIMSSSDFMINLTFGHPSLLETHLL